MCSREKTRDVNPVIYIKLILSQYDGSQARVPFKLPFKVDISNPARKYSAAVTIMMMIET
jgi:hypothetical protein